MKIYLPIIFLIISILVSCQLKVNTLIFGEEEETRNTPYTDKTKDDGLKTIQQNELILHIQIPSKDTLYLSIEKIPILNSYLEESEDKKNEINRIQSRYLFTNNEKDYILVNYSCGTKVCNQLLLEYKQQEIQSLQVSESSFLQISKYSNDYLAFLFGRNEGSEILRNKVVIIDLKNFKKISPSEDLLTLESFEYPIPMIEWNEGTLIATIADIEDTSYECIEEWYKNNQTPIQQLKWKIQ